ncbi:hypothetical protein PV05_07708 [Exophiala xenobiotica]|uniref:Alcohol dehydrogenase-like C-terminal domain-containing protein n=1 Tax=Exophiala xenobiotica TaxID=348802 RepID=A0A0D2EBL2_9EURO|nr:uncharacterized protein PV05_07708 [Exophiala xenobiotica]KIW52035.1 hypothetical protein PV05_07708 [Exophiala xenobiotica]
MKDVDEALVFIARDLMHPVLTKGTLGDVDKYARRILEAEQAGRVVLKVT